jgi:hypothetical protein
VTHTPDNQERLLDQLGDVLDIIAAARYEFARTKEHHDYYAERFQTVEQLIAALRTQPERKP